ncbi:MAG TPA: beta-ketoacyl-[acyl-carrier-protein] synthase II [Fuerstia sp.]|nr:beta-ketoacyl-[acyl-carrier-protein] synthase II [Fuerstiella sp.]
MSRRRVVVTGTAVVTALGCDLSEVWTRVCNGQSGVTLVQRFDCSQFRVRIGGEIKDFDAHAEMKIESKVVRRMDRFAQFAIVAADKAIRQSGIDFSKLDPYRCGVLIGSGVGGLDELENQHSLLFDRGPERVSAFMIPKIMINSASGNVSMHWGLRGPSSAVATACASGAQAIGNAYRMIQSGMADVMVTGGSEAPLTPLGISGFARMNAISQRNQTPELASRPFDRDRDGFVMSEGAGMLLIEELETARRRGAEILAEVVGYGLSSDGTHMTAPDETGAAAARAMQAALQDAELNVEQVDYINAHGTGTPLGDRAESLAIRTVFADQSANVAVSSTKGQLGHLLGASGGVESAFCVKAIETQTAPPSANLEATDDGCDLNFVQGAARDMPIRIGMKNSFAFGGHNACLIYAAPD